MSITTRVLNAQPWRFAPGDAAYVRGWPEESTVVIVAQLLSPAWPHYVALDIHGNTWRLPQIHLSRSPITDR